MKSIITRFLPSLRASAWLITVGAACIVTTQADILLSEDFNAGDGGFVEDSSGNSPIPFEYNNSGTWSLEGDDSGPSTYTLTSPEIPVSGTAGIQVTFAHRYSIEPEWDGLALEVSFNGGEFTVVPNVRFSQNGYTFSGLIGNHVLAGGDGFNADSDGYGSEEFITSIADVGAVAAGGKLQIRFLGAFDEGARGEGIPNWEIDSVVVETLPDQDGDGISDDYEDENGLDSSVNDAAGDLDGDTVSNVDEFVNATDPQKKDTDGDGLDDNVETGTGTFASAMDTGTDPLIVDSDRDGLLDGVETGTGTYVGPTDTGTDPNKKDTDGDNFADALEVNNNSDPTNPLSVPAVPTFEVLDDLIGGDLTDPEDDGDEDAGEDDPSWNWVSIESNDEPGFQGGEFSYNVFDNKKDAGGNDKWCCMGASEAAPLQLTVEFEMPTRLTHLTITSANDTPARDPLDWKILGSNDGDNFSVIFERAEDLSLWQELIDENSPPRFTTIKVTLPVAAPPFKFIRYEVTRTGNANHQIGELEYFGTTGRLVPLQISEVNRLARDGKELLEVKFPSSAGASYTIETGTNLDPDDWTETVDGYGSQGEVTVYELELTEPIPSELYIRVREEE